MKNVIKHFPKTIDTLSQTKSIWVKKTWANVVSRYSTMLGNFSPKIVCWGVMSNLKHAKMKFEGAKHVVEQWIFA